MIVPQKYYKWISRGISDAFEKGKSNINEMIDSGDNLASTCFYAFKENVYTSAKDAYEDLILEDVDMKYYNKSIRELEEKINNLEKTVEE